MDRRNFITSTGLLLGSLIVAPKIVLGKREIATIHHYGADDDPFYDMIFMKKRPHVNKPGVMVDVYTDPFTSEDHQLHTYVFPDSNYGQSRVIQYWYPDRFKYRPGEAILMGESYSMIRNFINGYRDKYPSEEWGWARIKEALEKQDYKYKRGLVVYSSAGILDHKQHRYEKDSRHKAYVRYYPAGTISPGGSHPVYWTVERVYPGKEAWVIGCGDHSWVKSHVDAVGVVRKWNVEIS